MYFVQDFLLCCFQSGDQTEETPVSQEGVPPGYEAVSLIEALNGPCGLPPLNTMEGKTNI